MIRDPRDKKSWQKGREALKYRMIEIDKDIREKKKSGEKRDPQAGVRKIVLDAYKTNGKNGAMLALRIFNKKANSAYAWNDVETWIKEENKKEGLAYGDD